MRDFRLDIGRLLDGRYKLLDLLGSGASGAVFRAYDTETGIQVSVKLFDGGDDGEQNHLSFLTEAEAVSALSHENIVRLYRAGAEGNDRYLVMEYIDGTTLREYMDNRHARMMKIPTGEIISCARQVLQALSAAHKKQIVHRDVKPQNIILTKTGKLKVMDFGIAKLPGGDAFDGDRHAVGTAHYISPEQAAGNPVDARSDIYSFGILLYEMATGVLPFTGSTPSEIAMRQVTDTPAPPRALDPTIPVGLEQIILTAMQKNPDRRFRNADEMLRAVEKLAKKPSYVFGDFSLHPSTQTGIRRTAARNSSVLPAAIGVVSGVAAVLLILTIILISRYEKSREPQLMPSLIGEYYDENVNYGSHIAIENVEYTYSDSVPAGCVAAQTPAPGGSYADTIRVTLTVSLGRMPVSLADLPSTETEARSALESAGLIVSVVYVSSDSAAEGTVMQIVSPDGTPVAGSLVTLTVSTGPRRTLPMTDLIGKTEAEAVQWLNENGIYYRVTVVAGERGRVLSQSVSAGEDVAVRVSDALTLTVGGGIG